MNHSLPWEDFSLSLVYPDCKLQHTFSGSPYCSCDGLLQATLYLFNNKKSLKHIIDKKYVYIINDLCSRLRCFAAWRFVLYVWLYFPHVLLKFRIDLDTYSVNATNFSWTVADSVNNSSFTMAPGLFQFALLQWLLRISPKHNTSICH